MHIQEYKYVLDQLKDKGQPMMARFFAAGAASPTTAKPAPALRDAATVRDGLRGSGVDTTTTPLVRPAPERRAGGSQAVVAARALWPVGATESSRSRADAAAAAACSVAVRQRDPRKGKAPAHEGHAERVERAEHLERQRELGERWYVAFVTVDAMEEEITTRLHQELVTQVGEGRVVVNSLSEAAVDLRRVAAIQEADRREEVTSGMGLDRYMRTDHERASEALQRVLAAVCSRVGSCSVRGWLAEDEAEDDGGDVAMEEAGAHAQAHACIELDGDADGAEAERAQRPGAQAGGMLFQSEDFDEVLASIAVRDGPSYALLACRLFIHARRHPVFHRIFASLSLSQLLLVILLLSACGTSSLFARTLHS
jgi:hypothetical protein